MYLICNGFNCNDFPVSVYAYHIAETELFIEHGTKAGFEVKGDGITQLSIAFDQLGGKVIDQRQQRELAFCHTHFGNIALVFQKQVHKHSAIDIREVACCFYGIVVYYFKRAHFINIAGDADIILLIITPGENHFNGFGALFAWLCYKGSPFAQDALIKRENGSGIEPV